MPGTGINKGCRGTLRRCLRTNVSTGQERQNAQGRENG